ncbi:MAG: protein kinase [Betaproteobacteria bacterium]|nr:protein kinase [Betaproteobacteria bacterium]
MARAQNIYRNALQADAMLQEYRIDSVLGAGGFGMTYLGLDTHLEKYVAIKEYLPTELAMRAADGTVVPLTSEREADYRWGLERFILEARTLARFNHRNIVRVSRFFEANGTGYMVMDYERGAPLAQRLKREPPLDEAALKRLVAPLLDGLRVVHAAGFLHRDIKPDNIFVREGEDPVLIDFGAARQSVGGATRNLTAVLTPGYAPMEQYVSDGHQGPWTDLYAFGGVLFRAVTGAGPPDAVSRIKSDSVGEALARVSGLYSEPFLRAIEWALALDEKRRPQDVAAWHSALIDAGTRPAPAPAEAGAESTVLQPTAPAPLDAPPPKPALRRRWIVPAAGVILTLVALAGFLVWQRAARIDSAKQAERIASETRPPVATAADEALHKLRREVESEFLAADTNRDGYLSPDEVRGRFPVIAKAFERVDTDGDGRISLQEFMRARRLQFERRVQKQSN